MRASESCLTAAIPAMKLRRPQPTILWTHLDSLDHGTKDKEVIFRLAWCKNHTSSLYVTATGNGKHVRVVAVCIPAHPSACAPNQQHAFSTTEACSPHPYKIAQNAHVCLYLGCCTDLAARLVHPDLTRKPTFPMQQLTGRRASRPCLTGSCVHLRLHLALQKNCCTARTLLVGEVTSRCLLALSTGLLPGMPTNARP